MVLLDDDLRASVRGGLAIVFFWAVITSHYGIGPLVLFSLIVAYILNVMTNLVFKNKQPSRLRFGMVLLCVVLTFSWYAYLTGGSFYFVVNSIYKQVSGSVIYTSSSTAVRSLAIDMPSFSYQVVFYGHLTVGALTSLGLGLVYLRYVMDGIPYGQRLNGWVSRNIVPEIPQKTIKESNFLHLVIGLYLFFPLSFGPQILSAGRTFGLVMTLLAPFAILTLRSVRVNWVGSKPAVISILVLLLVTSGFVSATVTHDVSPQPIIDGNRIEKSGTMLEQFAYYAIYNPRNSLFASNFIWRYFPDDSIIRKTTLGAFIPTFFGGEDRSGIETVPLAETESTPDSHIYLSEADAVTGTNTVDKRGFVYYIYEPLHPYRTRHKIYTTGKDRILT
jgi:uncharacterized membrane protein